MLYKNQGISRRELLLALGLAPLARLGVAARAPAPERLQRSIPRSGETLPAVGMGSWITFNVGDEVRARAVRVQVLQNFFDQGGALIDSSPMYGSSEEVIGHCLERLGDPDRLFSATKVWTWGEAAGIRQMERSRKLWGGAPFHLMQIHNLLDWSTHLATLKAWKTEGRIRYLGITTSHGRRHAELERLMRTQPLDFVQFTYNVLDREAEQRLLPLAADRGIAVIVNRPFQRGSLFERVAGHALPEWAGEIDCANWAQFFLKFIVSHPAVTCAILATSRPDHMLENMGALQGRLPGATMRRRMAGYIESL